MITMNHTTVPAELRFGLCPCGLDDWGRDTEVCGPEEYCGAELLLCGYEVCADAD